MTPEMWRRVEQECSELRDAPPERRGARLDELRAIDPELASTVEGMLAADVDADFLRPIDETSSRPPVPEPDVTLPTIKDFEVIRRIGRGGMGTVYLARDIQLDRLVALKVLATRPGDDAPIRSFRKEAQAVARLHHPGIVQIYRYGEEGDSWYIAMEFIDGATLAGRLKDDTSVGSGVVVPGGPVPGGPVPGGPAEPPRQRARAPRRTFAERRVLLQRDRIAAYARVLSEVADALDHAHQQGIIHRDVKPSNILIDREGHARLTDFGIARVADDATVSHADHITGTYPYMSPEQARVRAISIDHRSDIFSLGVVLYEILTLERPFGDDLEEVLRRLNEGEPRPVRQSNPAVDRDLAVICHKAIEIRPEDRYQSAAHMAADLRCWLNHQPILAHPPTVRRRVTRWAGRHRLRVAGASIVLLIAAVTLLLLVMKHRRDEQLAWLRIDPAGAGACTVRFQPVDPGTLDFLAPSLDETLDHEHTFRIAPGHYRVTITLAGHAVEPVFAELDLLLTSPGESAATTVRATTSDSSRLTANALVARLRSAADAASAPPRPMVTVAAGTFDLGLGEVGPVLQRRTIALDTFLLDRTEVSNADYLAFLRATAAGPDVLHRLDALADGSRSDLDRSHETRERNHHPNTPQFWKTSGYNPALAERPVVGLRIQDAAAYAHWAGKRLPTMFELEAALRGPALPAGQPRPEHPAGVDLNRTDYTDCGVLRDDQSTRETDHVALYVRCSVPVDSPDPFPSPSGAVHLYDNVREITSTVDLRNLDGVAKGRCWLDEPAHSPIGSAWTYPLTAWYYDRGFRCAKSAAPVLAP